MTRWARGNSGLSQGKLTLQLKEVGAGQAGVEWKENEAILEVKGQIEYELSSEGVEGLVPLCPTEQ